MKKKIAFISMTLIVSGLLYFTGINTGKTHDTGAPAGYTGSPYDGFTCDVNSCHNSHPLQGAMPWISSNVPVAGYAPDSIYTFTAKAVYTGYTSFGFEISPQTASGSPLGTLIVTNSSTTKIVTLGALQYITHTIYGYVGADSLVWSFNWKAPAKGTGSVTFYGAFNCGKGNASAANTYVYPATLVVPENMDASVNNLNAGNTSFTIYPNPAHKQVNINYNLKQTANVAVNLYGIDGKMIFNLANNIITDGAHTQEIALPEAIKPGVYLVQLLANGQSTVQRIIVE